MRARFDDADSGNHTPAGPVVGPNDDSCSQLGACYPNTPATGDFASPPTQSPLQSTNVAGDGNSYIPDGSLQQLDRGGKLIPTASTALEGNLLGEKSGSRPGNGNAVRNILLRYPGSAAHNAFNLLASTEIIIKPIGGTLYYDPTTGKIFADPNPHFSGLGLAAVLAHEADHYRDDMSHHEDEIDMAKKMGRGAFIEYELGLEAVADAQAMLVVGQALRSGVISTSDLSSSTFMKKTFGNLSGPNVEKALSSEVGKAFLNYMLNTEAPNESQEWILAEQVGYLRVISDGHIQDFGRTWDGIH